MADASRSARPDCYFPWDDLVPMPDGAERRVIIIIITVKSCTDADYGKGAVATNSRARFKIESRGVHARVSSIVLRQNWKKLEPISGRARVNALC